ncbi:hypothetical protein R1flu_024914 [Riccia fluitans]|uniref:Uncharacterized protein n=1 Tax=Riccia fluitans TaxID=41844 RepID=A0ABD1XW96_9MARC
MPTGAPSEVLLAPNSSLTGSDLEEGGSIDAAGRVLGQPADYEFFTYRTQRSDLVDSERDFSILDLAEYDFVDAIHLHCHPFLLRLSGGTFLLLVRLRQQNCSGGSSSRFPERLL